MDAAGDHYRIAAEEGGNSQAFFNLGWMHQHGVGLEKDKFLAKRYFDQAIESNPIEATLPASLALVSRSDILEILTWVATLTKF